MQSGDALPTCLKNGTKEIEAAYIDWWMHSRTTGLFIPGFNSKFPNRRGTHFQTGGQRRCE
jgi:hypothetical protein